MSVYLHESTEVVRCMTVSLKHLSGVIVCPSQDIRLKKKSVISLFSVFQQRKIYGSSVTPFHPGVMLV